MSRPHATRRIVPTTPTYGMMMVLYLDEIGEPPVHRQTYYDASGVILHAPAEYLNRTLDSLRATALTVLEGDAQWPK